jgi:hypothetical protein
VEPFYSKEFPRWEALWVIDDDPIEVYDSGKMEGDVLDEDLLPDGGCGPVR